MRLICTLGSILFSTSCSRDNAGKYTLSVSQFMSKVVLQGETEGLGITIGRPRREFKPADFVVSFWDKKWVGHSVMSITIEKNGKEYSIPIREVQGGRVSDTIWVFEITIPPELNGPEVRISCGVSRYPPGTKKFETKKPEESVHLILRRD